MAQGITRTLLVVLAAWLKSPQRAHALRVGDGWGTNIHWVKENADGEAAMIAAAYKIARMDFGWASIEKSEGNYNFEAYDGLLSTMEAHDIRPYWILDYGNPLYPPQHAGKNNGACDTEVCIEAFGKFAAATVAHFKGHNIIFECINEPNGMGGDNSTDIAALCLSAGKAFTAAGELFVGPTTAGMDWAYLNSSMAAGVLGAFGAVSVHPYRPDAPDTVLSDWVHLRDLITQYGSSDRERNMPMLSGEWGYTTAVPPCTYSNRVDPTTQAAYLARMWLSNTMAGVPVSINYDWRDNGDNETVCESNFGSVHNVPTGDATQPFKPKPKYQAALALQTSLGNFEKVAGRVTPTTVLAPPNTPMSTFSTFTIVYQKASTPHLVQRSNRRWLRCNAIVTQGNVFVLRFENSTSSKAVTVGPSRPAVGFAVWTNGTEALGQCGDPVPLRRDCGHYGIGKTECEDPTNPKRPAGGAPCCWEPDQPAKGGPQCYFSEHRVVADLKVTFSTAPGGHSDAGAHSSAGQCWAVSDMLGAPLSGAAAKVCADSSGSVTVDAPVRQGDTTTSPVYLLPL
jgi:hypothetical protein